MRSALEAGLLLLTTYAGLILLGLLVVFTLSSRVGRAQLDQVGPWIAGVAMTAVLFPYLIWLDLGTGISFIDLATIAGNLRAWGWLVAGAAVEPRRHGDPDPARARRVRRRRASPPPEVEPRAGRIRRRAALSISSRSPRSLAMGLFALFTRRPENFLAAPLVVLSGLAVVVAAGDRIKIEHQYVIGYAWAALIVLPPILVAFAIVFQPWTFAADLRIGRPAAEMGQFFGDSFARRTGRPLAVVAGDQALASLVALGAPSRPSLYRRRRARRPSARDAAGHRGQGRGGRLAGDRQRRPAAAGDRAGVSRLWQSKCRAPSRARTRAACR